MVTRLRLVVLAVLLLLAGFIVVGLVSARAQQTGSVNEQALSNRLLQELSANVQCSAGLLTAEAKVKQLEAELAKLKPAAKAEPKK